MLTFNAVQIIVQSMNESINFDINARWLVDIGRSLIENRILKLAALKIVVVYKYRNIDTEWRK